MTPTTSITIKGKDFARTTTWGEFIRDNPDLDHVRKMETALDTDRVFMYGGGAAPEFTIRTMSSMFRVWSPDQVAECMDGIVTVPGLYEALWGLVKHYEGKPRSECNDDFGDRALENWWDELSEDHQAALNRLADEFDAKNRGL